MDRCESVREINASCEGLNRPLTERPKTTLEEEKNTTGSLDGENMNGAFQTAFVIKYSSGGTKIWTRLTGGTGGSSHGNKIAVDNGNGSLFVTGNTNVGLDGVPKIGSQDAFILKYDFNGNKIFTKLSW